MAAEQELENMTRALSCPICLEFYEDPVSMDCEHIFCRACILRHWGRAEGSAAFCPQCREPAHDRRLRPNRFAASMVASVRRLVEGTRRQEAGRRCPEHDERLKLFCEDDRRAICLICAMSRAHKDHAVRPLKEKLEQAIDTLQTQLEEMRIAKDEDTENLKVLKKQAGSLRARIETEFDEMQRFLSDEKLALLSKLEEQEKAITQQIEENMKKLLDESTLINQGIIDIQRRQTDAIPILDRLAAESRKAGSVSVALSLEEFNGPLQ
uniref:E3 ubiquitin-protein ligase TRIM39-like isoform X2 n=1 Tax=Pristiophorus japonicus TaxID=55135 RepID=UPI00398ED84B